MSVYEVLYSITLYAVTLHVNSCMCWFEGRQPEDTHDEWIPADLTAVGDAILRHCTCMAIIMGDLLFVQPQWFLEFWSAIKLHLHLSCRTEYSVTLSQLYFGNLSIRARSRPGSRA